MANKLINTPLGTEIPTATDLASVASTVSAVSTDLSTEVTNRINGDTNTEASVKQWANDNFPTYYYINRGYTLSAGSVINTVASSNLTGGFQIRYSSTNENNTTWLGYTAIGVKRNGVTRRMLFPTNLSDDDTFAMKGEVDTVGGEVSTVKGNVETISETLGIVKGNLETVTESVESLSNSLSSVQRDVETLGVTDANLCARVYTLETSGGGGGSSDVTQEEFDALCKRVDRIDCTYDGDIMCGYYYVQRVMIDEQMVCTGTVLATYLASGWRLQLQPVTSSSAEKYVFLDPDPSWGDTAPEIELYTRRGVNGQDHRILTSGMIGSGLCYSDGVLSVDSCASYTLEDPGFSVLMEDSSGAKLGIYQEEDSEGYLVFKGKQGDGYCIRLVDLATLMTREGFSVTTI